MDPYPPSQAALLEECRNRFTETAAEIHQLIANLSVPQLLWKPAPDKWSIAQVIDHLIINNEKYYPQLDRKTGMPAANPEQIAIKPGFWGGMLVKMVDPSNRMRRKMKTPRVFRPSPQPMPENLKERWDRSQQLMLEYLHKASVSDLRSIRLYSPAARLMRFHAGDAFLALARHQTRHMEQIRALHQSPEFPAS